MGDGGKGSDGGGSGKKLEKMAKDYYEKTDPMRQSMIGNYENFLGGDYDVSQNPVWGPSRDVLEGQYDVARENVISNVPKGGALTEQLTNVDTARAEGLGGLASNIAQDEYNKAYGMATGAPGQSFGAMSNLAGQQAMAQSQQTAGKYGALGDMGMGAGYVLGAGK